MLSFAPEICLQGNPRIFISVLPSSGEKNCTSLENVNHHCDYEEFVLKQGSTRGMLPKS
jgi:hypothetical protein